MQLNRRNYGHIVSRNHFVKAAWRYIVFNIRLIKALTRGEGARESRASLIYWCQISVMPRYREKRTTKCVIYLLRPKINFYMKAPRWRALCDIKSIILIRKVDIRDANFKHNLCFRVYRHNDKLRHSAWVFDIHQKPAPSRAVAKGQSAAWC